MMSFLVVRNDARERRILWPEWRWSNVPPIATTGYWAWGDVLPNMGAGVGVEVRAVSCELDVEGVELVDVEE